MLVGVSIGARRDGTPKDSLANLRASGHFCLNVVTRAQLEVMNETSADLAPDHSEFEFGAVELAWTESTRQPFVADCPAVLECVVFQDIPLPAPGTALILAEVTHVRLVEGLRMDESWAIDPTQLDPVGRLGGPWYALTDQVQALRRPREPLVPALDFRICYGPSAPSRRPGNPA